ncbi:DUF222 domain-containing protein [Actinomycetes bacterium M1A6_2h]
MFEPGGSSGLPGAVGSASELAAALSDAQRQVNRLDAVRVHHAYDLLDVHLSEEFDRQARTGDGDHVRASRTAACTVSQALGLSFTVAVNMIDAGEQLWHRLPLVDTEFTAGTLGYDRIKVITSVLAHASDTTVAVLEPDVLAAAQLYHPKSLRDAIWELWFDHNPEEAAEARKRNLRSSTGVRRSKRPDGGADVVITTDESSADDFMARVDEIAATVCENDTRTKGQLRAAAASAMAQGNTAIACKCGLDDCPVKDVEITPPPGKRIIAHMGIELLLGLTSNPPTLADGTPLPPDVARLIATDAQWQLILTELVELAAPEIERRERERSAQQRSATEVDGYEEKGTAPADKSQDSTIASETPPAPVAATSNQSKEPVSAPSFLQHVRVMRRRSRVYEPPPLPNTDTVQPHRPRLRGWHSALLAHIDSQLEEIRKYPELALGVFPDGQGGHSVPPKGALSYKPTVEVSALVRARYRTCTAPGCTRPFDECQLDHVVAFDHDNPSLGGWTIAENIQPLCLVHHQAKTEKRWRAAILAGGFVCWRLDTGTVRITAPSPAVVALADLAFDDPAVSEPDAEPNGPWRRKLSTPLPDDIHSPTWWEKHHLHHEAREHLTLSAIARLKTSEHRDTARRLRNKYLEHRAVVRARSAEEPPPF